MRFQIFIYLFKEYLYLIFLKQQKELCSLPVSHYTLWRFLFLECKSELVHRSSWNWAREPNQESPRARGFVLNSMSFYK